MDISLTTASALQRLSNAYWSCFHRSASAPPDPKAYLLKGEGEKKLRVAKLTLAARPGSPASTGSSPTWGSSSGRKRIETERLPSPPKAGAANARANPPNTTFRKFFERGDLPISVDHKSFKNTIKWKVSRHTAALMVPTYMASCSAEADSHSRDSSRQTMRVKPATAGGVSAQARGGLQAET
jgi:hypothetical protein